MIYVASCIAMSLQSSSIFFCKWLETRNFEKIVIRRIV